MSRLDALMRRYAASAAVARNGVDVVAVGDVAGGAFDLAVRGLVAEVREDGPGPWDEMLAIAKALRWRRLARPQPLDFNEALSDGYAQLSHSIDRLRGAVSFGSALDRLADAGAALLREDPPVGSLLERSVGEVGPSDCAVFVTSRATQAGVRDWLGASGVRVLVSGELDQADDVSLIYAVGPPRFFPASLATAPPTEEVTYLLPTWFADVSIPRSSISAYCEGALRVQARVTREGAEEVSEPSDGGDAEGAVDEADLQPMPLWGSLQRPGRHPELGEVEARKLLLAGDLALWLDDGDRIRAVDPRQPPGERVIYADVGEVGVGTILLVRTGTTERRVLYDAALKQLGPLAAAVDSSQTAWKDALAVKIRSHGYPQVARALRDVGVRTYERARAWTDPNLIRPHSDSDFLTTLDWLGISAEPSFSNANGLRRALYQASADVREELEMAVSAADLDALDRHGLLNLEVETTGFRGILATTVLAVAPTSAIVQRREARVPFADRSARWLE